MIGNESNGQRAEMHLEVEMRTNINISQQVLGYLKENEEYLREKSGFTGEDYSRLCSIQPECFIIDFYHDYRPKKELERLRVGYSRKAGTRFFMQTKRPSEYHHDHMTEEKTDLTEEEFLFMLSCARVNVIIAGSRQDLIIPYPDIEVNFDRVYSLHPRKLNTENMDHGSLEEIKQSLINGSLGELVEHDLGDWTEFEATHTISDTIEWERASRTARAFASKSISRIKEFAELFGIYEYDDAPADSNGVPDPSVAGYFIPWTYPEAVSRRRLKSI